jgi:hypothetical protein
MLVVIGPEWKAPEDANDPVRIQIETALKRDLLMIPVLADDVAMPEASALPEPLRGLTVRRPARRRDLAGLVEAIRSAHPHEPTLTDKWLTLPWGVRLIVYACFGTLAWVIFQAGGGYWYQAILGALCLYYALVLAAYSARTGFKNWTEFLLSLVLAYAGGAAVSALINSGLGSLSGDELFLDPGNAALAAEIIFTGLLLVFTASRWIIGKALGEGTTEVEDEEEAPDQEWPTRWLRS